MTVEEIEEKLELLEAWLIAGETGDTPVGINYPSLRTSELWGIKLPV